MSELVKIQPFRGGVDTVHEIALIPAGKFSVKQNWRDRHPGLEKRKGQIRHHSTASTTTETTSLFQTSKARRTERHLWRQLSDGSIEEATDNPPTVTTGAFGTQRLGLVSGAIPASWSMFNDFTLMSDGVRQHQIYAGTEMRVRGFLVSGATSPTYYTDDHKDYSLEVTDGDATTKAILDALGINERFYVLTHVPTQSIKLTVTDANGNASVLSGKYYGGSWKAMSGLSDGTASAGKTLAQTGSLTWTAPTDELPAALFGYYGFWYEFTVSAALSATVRVSEVSYTSGWQSIYNLCDGVLVDPIEAIFFIGVDTTHRYYSSDAITIGGMLAADYVYFSTVDPVEGILMDANTPHTEYATVTGSTSITFVDGGATADYIEDTVNANFQAKGFEKGMSITITGTASNNVTKTIVNVTPTRIYVPTASLTGEANTSAVITAPTSANDVFFNIIEVYNGVNWSTITQLTYNGNGTVLTGSNYVFLDRTSVTPKKTNQFGTPYEAYWYRMSLTPSTIISSKTNIGIQVMPYFTISDFGIGMTNSTWKGRVCYTFDRFPNDVYISAQSAPMVLNGKDFGIVRAGDGRINKVLCMKKFMNELMVWQEEKGELGGCVTLIQGFSPETYGKFIISNRIGIMNSKSAAVVDSILALGKSGMKPMTLAFWLSREGVFTTDGQYVTNISGDIVNYFDPIKTECIRAGYESKHWLAYDAAYNAIMIGLVSGASATLPNIFLVYDLIDHTWGFDTRAQNLSCLINVEAASGNIPILQVAGGTADGYVYQINQTLDDVTTAIDAICSIELNGNGNKIQCGKEIFRVKSQSTGNVTRKIYVDGTTTLYGSAIDFPQTTTLPPQASGSAFCLHRFVTGNATGTHLKFEWRHNTLAESCFLEEVGLDIKPISVF